MLFIEQRAKIRLSVFENNIQRAKSLSLCSRHLDTSNFTEILGSEIQFNQFLSDIGMYSVVASISSIDEFIKTLSADALFGYLTNQWNPPRPPTLGKIKTRNLFKITHLSTELIRMSLAGEDILDPLNSTFINDFIHRSTKDINFQSYDDFSQALKELTGTNLYTSFTKDGIQRSEIDYMKQTIDYLTQKRHEYVHRMATFSTTPGGDHKGILFDGPVTDEQLEVLRKVANQFSSEIIQA